MCDLQALIIAKASKEYKILPKSVAFLVGDNASVNPATARLLKDDHGFSRLSFTACLPHCLNLVLRSFLSCFDEEYGISSHLRLIRAYIKQGGSHSRKSLLVMYGCQLSQIDFSDTRWSGLVSAIIYMAGLQSPHALREADKRLTLLYEETNDPAFLAELQKPDQAPERNWDCLFEAVEEMEQIGSVHDRADSGITNL